MSADIPSSNPSIEQAQSCHQSGDLPTAADICRAILKTDPQNLAAIHLLAVVLSDAGLNDQALGFFEQAIAIGGPNSSVLHNYGVALQGTYDYEHARRAFKHAVEAAPLRTDSWYHLGEIEMLRGHWPGAVPAFEKVLEQDGDSVEARNNLSIALRKMGRTDEALEHLQTVIKKQPKDAAAQNNLGIVFTELGELAAAKIAFQTALTVVADYADAHYNLGNVYLAETDYDAASGCYLKALELEPENKAAKFNLALCRQKQKDYAGALQLLDQLIDAQADVASALGARSNVRRDMAEFDAALADVEAALKLTPDDPMLLGNKALTLQHNGQVKSAIMTYRKALTASSDNEQLHSNLAQALLLEGQFEEGWAEFEHRLQTPKLVAKRAALPGQAWQGELLTDKHLLLWCEQGLGDTIQFVRYVDQVAELAGKVSLMCPDRLVRLLQSYQADVAILGDSPSDVAVDFNAPLMSLPHLLAESEVLVKKPYLSAAPELIEFWAAKICGGGKTRIGIAWQGNPHYEADHQRSIALAYFEPLLAKSQFQFFSLQRGYGQDQASGIKLIDLSSDLDADAAFVDTAAVMANLDLIITSDTAIPHLAGALGRPVWLMLPKTPDWRWQLSRDDSPWYPTMRLFRQETANDWSGVMGQVITALDQNNDF